jgi:hypothetical protein
MWTVARPVRGTVLSVASSVSVFMPVATVSGTGTSTRTESMVAAPMPNVPVRGVPGQSRSLVST